MNEDAACNNPCGGEPMACGNCPELRGQSSYEFDPYDEDYESRYQPEPPECTECGEYLDVLDAHYYSCPGCGHQPLR